MPFEHADAVDADAVGAPEVADHELLADLGDAAVPPRDFARVKADVALQVPAEQQDRLVQENAGTFIQGLELCRHGKPTRERKRGAWTLVVYPTPERAYNGQTEK